MYSKLFSGALALAVLFLCHAGAAGAVTPRLVKDINSVPVPGSSNPGVVASLSNGISLFVADDGLAGNALWRTDGTEAGTYRLTDPCEQTCDAYSFEFAAAGDRYFFITRHRADFGFGNRLWVTGGSEDDTFLLAEGLQVSVGSRHAWLADRGILYFVAGDPDHGFEVWRSDGTAAGTYRATDIAPGPASSTPQDLIAFQGKAFFAANDGTRGQALWVTDGTAAGTRMIRDPWPNGDVYPGPSHLRVAGNRLLFIAFGRRVGVELWASDGTPRGTQPISNLAPGLGEVEVYVSFVALDRYFFSAKTARGEELWVSDGTRGGTRVLTDFADPGALGGLDFPLSGKTINGKVVFRANGGPHGVEPWITDGTRAGTRLLRDICPGACSSSPAFWLEHGGRLYLSAADNVRGTELWSTDGTSAGTRLVRDLCRGTCSGYPNFFRVVGGRLLFTAGGPAATNGPQIWRTNGTPTGTVRVSAFERQLSFFEVGTVTGAIVFPAWDREHGVELWRSDGTRAGTRLVTDVNPVDDGGSYPRLFQVLGDSRVAFLADTPGADGTVRGSFWRSDGTAAGTVPHRPLPPCAGSGVHIKPLPNEDLLLVCVQGPESALWRATAAGPIRLTSPDVSVSPTPDLAMSGGRIFFAASEPGSSKEPWVSDGTPEGTRLVADLDPVGSSEPAMFTAFAGRAWFTAYSVANESGGRELWVTDGTTAGTIQVTQVNGGAEPEILGVHAGRLWFAAYDPERDRELWSTDGTVEGTGRMADILPNGSFAPTRLVSAGDRMFLSAGEYPGSSGLWVSDGTAAGTRRLGPYPIRTDLASTGPLSAVVDGRLFYVAYVDGQETLWQSDGTEAGTGPVPPPADPGFFRGLGSLISFDGVLLFMNGEELWQADGTAGGTVRVEGLENPREPTLAGSRVFLRAGDPVHGTELWGLEPDQP
jgi:ELWxxDGT repeat protein